MEKKLSLKERLALKNNPVEPLKVIKKEVSVVKKESIEIVPVTTKEKKLKVKISKPIKKKKNKEVYPGASSGKKLYEYYYEELQRHTELSILSSDNKYINLVNEFRELINVYKESKKIFREMIHDIYKVKQLKGMLKDDPVFIKKKELENNKDFNWDQCKIKFTELSQYCK